MFVVRRIAKVKPGKLWEVAHLMSKICEAYESQGRNKANVYLRGIGLPGEKDVVYAEWTEEKLEVVNRSKVPQIVFDLNNQLQPLLESYDIEFYEMVTPEKFADRNIE